MKTYVRNETSSAERRSLHTSLFSREANDEVLVTSRTFVVIGIGRTEPSVQRRENTTCGVARSERARERESERLSRALQGTVETHIVGGARGREKEGGIECERGRNSRTRERKRETV